MPKFQFRPGKFQPVVDVRSFDDPLEDNFTALDSDLNAHFVAVDSHIVEFLRPVKPNIKIGDNLFDHIDLDLLPKDYQWEYPGCVGSPQNSVFSFTSSHSSVTEAELMSLPDEQEKDMVSAYPAITAPVGSTKDVSLQTDDLSSTVSSRGSQGDSDEIFTALGRKVDIILQVLTSTVKNVDDLSNQVRCVAPDVSRTIQRNTVVSTVALRLLSKQEVLDLT